MPLSSLDVPPAQFLLPSLLSTVDKVNKEQEITKNIKVYKQIEWQAAVYCKVLKSVFINQVS